MLLMGPFGARHGSPTGRLTAMSFARTTVSFGAEEVDNAWLLERAITVWVHEVI